MRGEDAIYTVNTRCTWETPPHAWGRPLTPSFLLRHQKKHPHMRGEDATPRAVISFGKETPPHAWGRRHIPGIFLAYIRNTPTCVGKTHPTEVGKRTAWKHPHMRGEDQVQMIQQLSDAETPPHAWGRRLYGTIEGLFCRNTPTCVGKTIPEVKAIYGDGKHPHMRGEDKPLVQRRAACRETPPHAWGRPDEKSIYFVTEGETPPHAWGRLICIYCDICLCRNTPTSVGKTLNDH